MQSVPSASADGTRKPFDLYRDSLTHPLTRVVLTFSSETPLFHLHSFKSQLENLNQRFFTFAL